ncbi:alpha/beta hydrolase fold domain-containing protein [Embleya sp. NPDC050154]|uniref:alpha/beta hydrolase fold domain-containing protein n=1 Tax=Embleya sp. NPDC050154 TaxID=3363988 RepID=UPI0037BA943F
MHGGAWWLGIIEHFDPGCGNLAALADCVVVSADYRLAPEYPYPVPLEDAIAAWLWLREHATALGVDPTRMSIGGGRRSACAAPRRTAWAGGRSARWRHPASVVGRQHRLVERGVPSRDGEFLDSRGAGRR